MQADVSALIIRDVAVVSGLGWPWRLDVGWTM